MIDSPVYTLFLTIYSFFLFSSYESFGRVLRQILMESDSHKWTDVDWFATALRERFEWDGEPPEIVYPISRFKYVLENESEKNTLIQVVLRKCCDFNDEATLAELLLTYGVKFEHDKPSAVICHIYREGFIGILRILRLSGFDFSSVSDEILEAVDGADTKPAICI